MGLYKIINKYTLNNRQKYLIHKLDWNYLIILDACCYHYFKNLWKDDYVKMIKSPASCTQDWLEIVFPDKYDYTLFSANPFIGHKKHRKWRYNANEHFKKIHSVWYHSWDKEYGTVLPERMYKYCEFNAFPKSIIWFLQPHSPYIDLKSGKTPSDFTNWNPEKNAVDWESHEAREKYTIEDIKRLYISNLKHVIPYVKKLADILEPPIIITSDHAELLGEKGLIGHPCDLNIPELRNVPFVHREKLE